MTLTEEQASRLNELASIERRPHWVPPNEIRLDASGTPHADGPWTDVLQDALQRCLDGSSRRKPIDREPPTKHARYLQKKNLPWDPLAYFWKQRLKEALKEFKRRDHESRKGGPIEDGADFLVSNENPERAAEAILTAGEIYASLSDEGEREIIKLLYDGDSAREVERKTGISRDKIHQIIQKVKSAVGEPRPSFTPLDRDLGQLIEKPPLIVGPPTGFAVPYAPLLERTCKPPRPPRRAATAEELAEVRAVIVSIGAQLRKIKARRQWLLANLPDEEKQTLSTELASLGELERRMSKHARPKPVQSPICTQSMIAPHDASSTPDVPSRNRQRSRQGTRAARRSRLQSGWAPT